MTTMSSDGSRDDRMTFFEGARLIVGDGSEPMEGAGILVRDGLVAAAGPDVRPGEGDLRVDLAGKTVMPAIVNRTATSGLGPPERGMILGLWA
jgi:imidazolonepropionase-like amidohydrolase